MALKGVRIDGGHLSIKAVFYLNRDLEGLKDTGQEIEMG